MWTKKIFILTLIVLMSINAYLYLQNKYNPSAVEMHLDSNLTYKEIENIYEKSPIRIYSFNYIKKFRNKTLIMTTGNDIKFKDMYILHGQFISDLSKKVAVIGAEVADKYFKTENAVGKKLYILNGEYEVIGIIKGSDKIYIPFQDDLLNEIWLKRILKFEPDDKKILDFIVEDIKSQLNSVGISVIDTIVYKEVIYSYINLIVIISLYVLVMLFKRCFEIIKKRTLLFWNNYQKQKRTVEWCNYIRENNKEVFKIVGYIVGNIGLMMVIFKTISFIRIPDILIPDNLFSLNSYINIVKNIYTKTLTYMQYGLGDIRIDTTFINILIISLIMLFQVKRDYKLDYIFYAKYQKILNRESN